ncbi:hypothetical protein [Fibrella aquatilis]|uniref:Lipoprotein n=1 Tax=Fibrella aquatilis TaxID=2817059 RepID=A0A939G880_9BACT|nr:hypothetical protein [Fibrella aquatilis]MBO0931866.1 hypothetical protein [Fibrella aquatilis]
MHTIVTRTLATISLAGSLSVFTGCSTKNADVPLSIEQRNEQSTNAAIRVSGKYMGIRLQLDNNYAEGRDKANAYSLDVTAKGDSVQINLSGAGTAGTYDRLDLGTYAVTYTPNGSSNGGYFTVKKDLLKDYVAVSVIDRAIAGTSSRQVVYSLPITVYQYVVGTPRAGQFSPVKASDIFTTTQRTLAIFAFERTVTLAN